MNETFYQKRVAEKVPTSNNPEMTSLVSRVERWCRIANGTRVLDFGCYDGYLLRKLRERNHIEGIGVDIAPAAVELAKKLSDLDGLEFVVSDGLPLPFPTASFDVVVCSEVLEHVPDLEGVLNEVARVIAPGGRLYATMPNSLNDVWPPFRTLCLRVDEVEGHLRRMTREELVDAITSHGFAPARVEYRGFLLSAIWYRTFIYRPRVKAIGIQLVGSGTSVLHRLARAAAYAGMRIYMFFDRPFSGYRRCLSIDAAFIRSGKQGE
jgi:SAM-dependent methyltransferase